MQKISVNKNTNLIIFFSLANYTFLISNELNQTKTQTCKAIMAASKHFVIAHGR